MDQCASRCTGQKLTRFCRQQLMGEYQEKAQKTVSKEDKYLPYGIVRFHRSTNLVDFSGKSSEISFEKSFWLSNLSSTSFSFFCRMSCSIKRSSSTKLSKAQRFNAPALTSKVFLGHIKYTYVSHKVKNEIQIINERHL